jgi:gas vesicle protein GvpA/GvpJ/GvpM family
MSDRRERLDDHLGGSVTEAARSWGGSRPAVRSGGAGMVSRPQPANLVDVLERVLDKGIVIAGDIKVNLLDIELLTIKIRLLIASVDRAREMGIDWWEHDPELSGGARRLVEENRELRSRVEALESRGSGESEGRPRAEGAGAQDGEDSGHG